MRKVARLLILISVWSVSSHALANSKHLESLRSRYPYGLIGDDYGILNEEDLSVNTCGILKITPFSMEKNMAYSYWQCFELKNTKVDCSSLGHDLSLKMTTGYLAIDAINKMGLQSYLARDAMNLKDCYSYVRRWKQKTHGERYVCISGSYGGFDGIRDGHRETDWVFDKFKTFRGCVSNHSDCRLSHPPDENCILPKYLRHSK